MQVTRRSGGACGMIVALVSVLMSPGGSPAWAQSESAALDPFADRRERMVQRHLVERGIQDERVLDAFRSVPRHRFLDPSVQAIAYEDESIPIGEGQTITPPYDVALMTEALRPRPTDRVLEIGTGSGYQAAILSRLVGAVYSIEIHESLSKRATALLAELGYDNVQTRFGDGYLGWKEAAPFDAVIVTCAPEAIPTPLIEQLKEGGRMVIPLGSRHLQKLFILVKQDGKMVGQTQGGTLFVPMTGRAQTDEADTQPPAADTPAH